ncbi:MAG: hypothetical protein IJP92_02790 [Lachnospiraceae bacterium]|nr:hypothetical protein [Lachnospiraceae bacterium]
MSEFKIHIPGREKMPLGEHQQPLVRLSKEAYNALVELYNETYLSMGQLASELIMQSKDHVVFDKE